MIASNSDGAVAPARRRFEPAKGRSFTARSTWIKEEDFALYQHVVANCYRYHDAMLGRLLQLAGEEATVIVMSDHGFHSDARRPAHIPAEMAGPAIATGQHNPRAFTLALHNFRCNKVRPIKL